MGAGQNSHGVARDGQREPGVRRRPAVVPIELTMPQGPHVKRVRGPRPPPLKSPPALDIDFKSFDIDLGALSNESTAKSAKN